MEGKPASLYARLGGYDAIAAVVDDLLPRLRSDELPDQVQGLTEGR